MLDLFVVPFLPVLMAASAAVAMIVLRGGISRIFFDVVGTFQASRLIHDAEAASMALQGLFVDALATVLESAAELNEQLREVENTIVPIAREIQIATIEFEKFFDTAVFTNEQMDKMATSIRQIGAEFAYVGEEALSAGARAAQLQALYGPGVVEPLTRGGLALGYVGDMQGAEAQQALISLMQQNALVTGELTQAEYSLLDAVQQRDVVTASVAKTLNKLNSVEDRSAARMPEIIEAMNHFGGVARMAGEDIGYMAAMTATLIERGIRAETAGTALRFVYARVGGNINGAGDALNALGVATHDANGELRPMQQVLNDLAPAFRKMSDQEQQALAQTMAGNRHYARLLLLMQDLERANMLYGESIAESGKVMEETGEAAGYLAELFADTAFQIEQTEARINNLQAAIGERLLPAQLEALQAQEALLIAIDTMIEQFEGTGLGGFVGDLYEMRLIIQDIFVPFGTLLINVYSLHIAMSALRQVLRAIGGERIAFIKGQIANNEMVLIQEQLKASRAEISNQKAKKGVVYSQIQARFLKIRAMQQTVIIDKQNIELAQKRLVYLLERQTALEQLKRAKGQKTMLKLTQVRLEIKQLEAQIEAGITLDTEKMRAITKQINDLEREHLLLVDALAISTEEMVALQKKLALEIEKMNAGLKESGMLAEGLMHKLSGAQMVGMALSMTGMVVSMILMSVGTEINKLLPKFLEFDNSAEVMAASLLLMASSFIPVILNMAHTIGLFTIKASTMAWSILMTTKLTIRNLYLALSEKGVFTSILAVIVSMKAKAAAAWLAVTAEGALSIANLKLAASATYAAIANTALGAAMGSVFVAAVGLAVLTGVGIALVAVAAAAIEGAKRLFDFNFEMDETLTNLEEMESHVPSFDMGGWDEYTEGITAATEAQEKFKNSREEMFFGFKAGNVQGALVKQIQQQGVETFIANTEVIQTNNFNGMTTREMANVVLDAIEREAGVRGINLSGASV